MAQGRVGLKLRLNDLKINLHYCYFKDRYMVTSHYCPEPALPLPSFLPSSPTLLFSLLLTLLSNRFPCSPNQPRTQTCHVVKQSLKLPIHLSRTSDGLQVCFSGLVYVMLGIELRYPRMLGKWFIKGTVPPPPSRVIFVFLNHNSWPHYVAKVRNFRREKLDFQQDKAFDTLLHKEMETQKSKVNFSGLPRCSYSALGFAYQALSRWET